MSRRGPPVARAAGPGRYSAWTVGGRPARLAGAYAVAAHRTVYLTAARRVLAGADPDTVAAESADRYRQAFDAAGRALDAL